MSLSKNIIAARIKTATLALRFVGWLRTGDARRYKPQAEMLKADMLTTYFARKYLPAVKNIERKTFPTQSPETIWQFWDNPAGRTTPEIVKSCIDSVKKFKGNFEHKILNNSTLENYSDLPEYVLDKFKKGQMDYMHFSDLLRLNLLKNHGGVWMDATCFMTDFIPKYIIGEDFFVFLTGDQTHYPYSFMQSCFIRSKKGSFLCDAWHQICIEYWKKEVKKLEYFQIHLMFKALIEKNIAAQKLFAKMPQASEDGIQQLVGDNLLKKFDADEWDRIKKASFFQKTTYKVADDIDCSNTYFSKICEGKI